MCIRELEGLGCEWLVWEGLDYVTVGLVYKIVEITAASSDNGGVPVLGLLCVGRNRAGSNLAVHFDLFSLLNFSKCWQFKFVLDRICAVICSLRH